MLMVSIKNLQDLLNSMKESHKSGEGADYETIRGHIETFEIELTDVKQKASMIKITIDKYSNKQDEIKKILKNLWRKASKVPTCRLKIRELGTALEARFKEAKGYISDSVKIIETQSDLGEIVGNLSSLVEKLEEEPYKELEQQTKELETTLGIFLRIRPHCRKKEVTTALEQVIFLEGVHSSVTPEKLISYAPTLKEKEAKSVLRELSEKNCGIKLEYRFDVEVSE